MDEDTLVVAYREWRGEPRGKLKKGEHDPSQGDCIDCMACVNVCPMGIDIRDGQQLECITCALCIDACDDMMAKIGKPRGLIDYMAYTDEKAERAGGKAKNIWKHVFRPRTILYTTLWSLVGVGLVVALFIRPAIDMTVAPVRQPTFVTLSDGTIRNVYEIKLRNKHGEERPFTLSITGDDTLSVKIEGDETTTVMAPPDTAQPVRVYVEAPKGSAAADSERIPFRFWVEDDESGERAYKDTVFNGRAN
jgi:cytochrome c oxidase accessory protein FixG